jgi:N-acetylglucosamine-6-phosphate deacetylase
MCAVAKNAVRARGYQGTDAASVLGLYCEGPFQQPELTGASLKAFALAPSMENVDRLLADMGDAITMANVAPGLDGDVEAVARLRKAGKVVSMAHSNALTERIVPCIEAGTTVLGHAWDNNSGRIGDSGVQQPTIEHVAMTDDRVRFIHMICDGVHVHPVMMRLLLRTRGVDALCLVTDAVTRAGMPDGPYVWDDGRNFTKKGGVGRTDTGWLCGSATLLPDMFRNLIKYAGVAPSEAIRTVSLNPAASLGLDDKIGLIAERRSADLVVWDSNLRVRRVWRAGVEISNVSDYAEVEV